MEDGKHSEKKIGVEIAPREKIQYLFYKVLSGDDEC